MSQSLDRFSSNLSEDKLVFTRDAFPLDEQFRLVRQKGVYPYDYMDSFTRFSETSLPSRRDFYSILNDTNISEEEYKHAKDVWNAFKIKNLSEYHDLYLQTDVLLLADLITDIDQQLFIEKGMRGGTSYIAHRHAEANNKYMKEYNPERESSYIMYLDANNLYGWAMSQPLPFKDFKWLDPRGFDLEKFFYVQEKHGWTKGVILEVDLEYPEELHHLHNDYPLAPEKLIVSDDML